MSVQHDRPANVIPMPDPALRTALIGSDAVSAAALALAHVAGLEWASLTPGQMQQFREMALFAGLFASDDQTARLLAYCTEHARRAGEYPLGRLEEMSSTVRHLDVSLAAHGIRWAAEAIFGLHIDELCALRRLKDADDEACNTRLSRGGW